MCLQRLCGFCLYCFELVRQERDCWSRGIAQHALITGVIFPSVLTSRGLLFLPPFVAPKSVFSAVFCQLWDRALQPKPTIQAFVVILSISTQKNSEEIHCLVLPAQQLHEASKLSSDTLKK